MDPHVFNVKDLLAAGMLERPVELAAYLSLMARYDSDSEIAISAGEIGYHFSLSSGASERVRSLVLARFDKSCKETKRDAQRLLVAPNATWEDSPFFMGPDPADGKYKLSIHEFKLLSNKLGDRAIDVALEYALLTMPDGEHRRRRVKRDNIVSKILEHAKKTGFRQSSGGAAGTEGVASARGKEANRRTRSPEQIVRYSHGRREGG